MDGYDRCVGARRDGSQCTRTGSTYRDAGGPVWLCRQHAELLDEYHYERGREAAFDRIAFGVT